MRKDHCVACSATSSLHQHHLVPRALGGPDIETNLITLCYPCHDKVHAVTREYGGVDHATTIKVGMADKQRLLEALGIWKGSWRSTTQTTEYAIWKAERDKSERDARVQAAVRINEKEAMAAQDFAETLRTEVLNVYDISESLYGEPPTLREVAASLNRQRIRTRLGAGWTLGSAYDLLARLGLETRRKTGTRKNHKHRQL